MLFFVLPAISSILFAILTIIFLIIAFIKHKKNDFNRFIILATTTTSIITLILCLNVDVPIPTIYPLDSETTIYYTPIEIAIDSDDFFKTYYSLDGTDPKSGNVYEELIVISETATICARNKFLFWWSDISKESFEFLEEDNYYNEHDIALDEKQTIENNNSATVTNNSFSNYSDIELLRIAQTRYENKDYQGTIEIYQLEKMQNNAIAMCNLGYLYTNYYNYYNKDKIADYNKIINAYNKSDVLQGYRNKLAFYIKYGNEVFYEEENPKVTYDDIYELIKLLIDEYDDPVTKSYIVNCGKENGKDYNYDNFEYDYDFSIFYCLNFTDQFYQGGCPPDDTLSSFWKLKSWDPVEGHITATWQLSKYKYMNELEEFLYIEE